MGSTDEGGGAPRHGTGAGSRRAGGPEYRMSFERAPAAMALVGLDGRFIDVNQEFAQLSGSDRARMVGVTVLAAIHADDSAVAQRALGELISGRTERTGFRVRGDGPGHDGWCQVEAAAVAGAGGAIDHLVIRVEPVDEAVATDRELASARAVERAAVDASPIGMALLSLDHRFTRVNAALCAIAGCGPADLLGTPWASVTDPGQWPGELEQFRRLVAGEAEWYDFDKPWRRPPGSSVLVRVRMSVVRTGGRPTALLAAVQDLTTPSGSAGASLDYDASTGLPGEAVLRDRAQVAGARARRRGSSYAVVFVELNPPGPPVDALVQQAAQRVVDTVRLADTTARVGDSLVVLCEDVAGMDDAAAVASRLADSLARPFQVDGAEVRVAATVGLTLGRAGDDPDAVLRSHRLPAGSDRSG